MTQTAQRNGIALIITMVILAIIAALALSLAAVSATNLQVTQNNHYADSALCAAQSGMEFAQYLAADVNTKSTGDSGVDAADACDTWNSLCLHLQTCNYGGLTVNHSDGNQIITNPINFGSDANFSLQFFRDAAEPNKIIVRSIGTDAVFARTIEMELQMQKDSTVLSYAIAGCGRIIVTGDTTIDGPIFSTWYQPELASPVETTAETTINGTISTVLTKQEIANVGIQLETLDAYGNSVFDANGRRVYSSQDKVQGYHEGIYYGQPGDCVPGLNEDDYDTSTYKNQCASIPSSSSFKSEYFPHQPGDYTRKKDLGSYSYTRHIYEGQTFTDAKLPPGRNALFKNCTFEGIFFVQTTSNSSNKTKCNNVRFEDCQFNGIIVTDVPTNDTIKWVQNCLYFTGETHFNNTSAYQEATILAPNFNVNLGNTAVVEEGESSSLTGAIVGGIVDVRGNAEINGTIISMYDTSRHPEGYISNIGFADDGGSEGGVPEDVGVIRITCSPDKLLPSGVTSPIVIKPLQLTYREVYN